MKFTTTTSALVFIGLATIVTTLSNVDGPYVGPPAPNATSPSHKRSGRGIETRQNPAEVIGIALAVKEAIEAIIDEFNKLEDAVKQDNLNRGQFTQDTVKKLIQKVPSGNYVICHTEHTAKWDGVQGTDWYHVHQEFDIKVGGTIGYEIYGATSGEFTRKGDGGFLNASQSQSSTECTRSG
ncbi:hypothetical protein C8R43DRAFT_1119008 [Mycena crocata]|nr:hypothetical protein C8R43DRAFT_1119008 [Mycena crocata]